MPKGRQSKKPTSGERNTDRRNSKARKKNPKHNRSTGRTVDGYSPAKLQERDEKREQSYLFRGLTQKGK